MKNISILGSTGSIGESTLQVVAEFPEQFKVIALAAGRKIERVAEQARLFGVKLVSVAKLEDAVTLARELDGVEVVYGDEGLIRVATEESVDMVVSALVGAVGLQPTYAAIERGIDIALANKETLVMAGELMTAAAKKSGSTLLPVDSEHSAVYQALKGHDAKELSRVILTASGGPFRGKDKDFLRTVTLGEALNHPNWSMGEKITIDSATMMNKGLEVIEARWLFDVAPDKIDVTVHPQSIVHSMVEFVDGAIIAHMGVPDMRGPICYALGYPERLGLSDMKLDLWRCGSLTFEEPDKETFKCLALAYRALEEGGTMPAVLSGANEVAVDAFLNEEISFLEIADLVEDAMGKHSPKAVDSIETAIDADLWARETARNWIERNSR